MQLALKEAQLSTLKLLHDEFGKEIFLTQKCIDEISNKLNGKL